MPTLRINIELKASSLADAYVQSEKVLDSFAANVIDATMETISYRPNWNNSYLRLTARTTMESDLAAIDNLLEGYPFQVTIGWDAK